MPKSGDNITVKEAALARGVNPGSNYKLAQHGGGANSTASFSRLVLDSIQHPYLRIYLAHKNDGYDENQIKKARYQHGPSDNDYNYPMWYNLHGSNGTTEGNHTYFWCTLNWVTAGDLWWESDGASRNPANFNWHYEGGKIELVKNYGYFALFRTKNMNHIGAGTVSGGHRVSVVYTDKNMSNHATRYNTRIYSPKIYMHGRALLGVQINTRGEDKNYCYGCYPYYYGAHNNGWVKMKGISQSENPLRLGQTSKTLFEYYLEGHGWKTAYGEVSWTGLNMGGGQSSAGTGRYFNYICRDAYYPHLARTGKLYVHYGSNSASPNSATGNGKTWSTTVNPINPGSTYGHV